MPVVTTSGTAVANLHPAVLEAAYARVPLVALTADRPAELRGTGANQTTDQVGLFGGSVRLFARAVAPTTRHVGGRLARRWSTGALGRGARPGRCTSTSRSASRWCPDGDPAWPEPLDAEIDRVDRAVAHRRLGLRRRSPPARRTVVVAGRRGAGRARGLAEAGGWPLLAEPTSGHRAGPNALAAYRLLLDHLGGERRAGRRRRPPDAVAAR